MATREEGDPGDGEGHRRQEPGVGGGRKGHLLPEDEFEVAPGGFALKHQAADSLSDRGVAPHAKCFNPA